MYKYHSWNYNIKKKQYIIFSLSFIDFRLHLSRNNIAQGQKIVGNTIYFKSNK